MSAMLRFIGSFFLSTQCCVLFPFHSQSLDANAQCLPFALLIKIGTTVAALAGGYPAHER